MEYTEKQKKEILEAAAYLKSKNYREETNFSLYSVATLMVEYASNKPVEIPEITDECFKMPTDKQLIEIALLFNDGKLQKSKLRDMIAMSEFIINRLYENGDCSVPSSKE